MAHGTVWTAIMRTSTASGMAPGTIRPVTSSVAVETATPTPRTSGMSSWSGSSGPWRNPPKSRHGTTTTTVAASIASRRPGVRIWPNHHISIV